MNITSFFHYSFEIHNTPISAVASVGPDKQKAEIFQCAKNLKVGKLYYY